MGDWSRAGEVSAQGGSRRDRRGYVGRTTTTTTSEARRISSRWTPAPRSPSGSDGPHGVAAAREEFQQLADDRRGGGAPAEGAHLCGRRAGPLQGARGGDVPGRVRAGDEREALEDHREAGVPRQGPHHANLRVPLRTNYQRFLLDVERWLWENATRWDRAGCVHAAEYDGEHAEYDADGAVGGAATNSAKVTFTMNKKYEGTTTRPV